VLHGAAAFRSIIRKMVLPERIELSTSPLPRECSTTELRQPFQLFPMNHVWVVPGKCEGQAPWLAVLLSCFDQSASPILVLDQRLSGCGTGWARSSSLVPAGWQPSVPSGIAIIVRFGAAKGGAQVNVHIACRYGKIAQGVGHAFFQKSKGAGA
jgi:hypothetical protein